MPTIAIIGPYRIFFFSGDGSEPAHVHISRDGAEAKFWLNPVGIAWRKGFGSNEIRQIEKMVDDHHQDWLRKWNEYFDIR